MIDLSEYSTYETLRPNVKDGDIILVSGTSPISLTIRAATFSKMSHVALFFWIEKALMVFEAKEGVGLRFAPASLYVRDYLSKNTNIYFGRAPNIVHEKENIVYDTAISYRDASYGYHALVTVLAAQIAAHFNLDMTIDSDAVVCSILVQRVWEACGHEFPRLMAPGLFVDECQFITPIRQLKLDPVEVAP